MLFTEFIPGGTDLSQFLRSGEFKGNLKLQGALLERAVRFYAAEISSALLYLHGNGITFGCLSPDNISLDSDGHCKLQLNDHAHDTVLGESQSELSSFVHST